MCALHAAQLLHTILHRLDLIISLLPSRKSSLLRWWFFQGRWGGVIIEQITCIAVTHSLTEIQTATKLLCILTTTPQPFTALFPGPPGWADGRVQGKITRGRHTDHPVGCHSIRTNQCPPPPSSHFYRPDALPAAQPTVSKHWRHFFALYAFLTKTKTRMWANAQHDGRPAKYRWHPLFNAAKFGWRPLLECRAVTLPGRETRWNLLECPKLPNRSQPLAGGSSQYCEFFSDCRHMP